MGLTSSEIATQKFNAAVASGTIPDVVCVNKQDLKQLVDGDLVVDMAPYFEEYASDYLKSLIEAAGEACINACTYNGVQYGIPLCRQAFDIPGIDMLYDSRELNTAKQAQSAVHQYGREECSANYME